MAEPGDAPTAGDGKFDQIDTYLLDGKTDEIDFRDYQYRPSLRQLEKKMDIPEGVGILNQGKEGACTGFGLAAVINLLLYRREEDRTVSSRMLYEMAKKHDKWEGDRYSGSTCRAAIKGLYNMGVCSEALAECRDNDPAWTLVIDQAKYARKTSLGAYYRVPKRISDYHGALNEAGVLFASAKVHEGWERDNVEGDLIPYHRDAVGGHAFAIVGYDERGFWVQNSWGETWGREGLAVWTYEDWLEHGRDAWVLALALSTPSVSHLAPVTGAPATLEEGLFSRTPKRSEVAGHFAHIDDGDFDREGTYWTDLATVQGTADLVATNKKYDHLLFYAHGGLNSVKASARRIAAMKEVFKDNRIYPFHFMYDTGLAEEIKDLVLGRREETEERAGGLADFTDQIIEDSTRKIGRALWREMKAGARRPFEDEGAGTQSIGAFFDAFEGSEEPPQIHLVGHSTGAILLASLLVGLDQLQLPLRIKSCSLMAPACTHELFSDVYLPLLRRPPGEFGIDRLTIYNLTAKVERDDTVTPLYRKSLLYLVSNAFEEQRGERILGMEAFRNELESLPGEKNLHIETSDGTERHSMRTTSTKHGGFDNDVPTMNDVLQTVLADQPVRLFTKENLAY